MDYTGAMITPLIVELLALTADSRDVTVLGWVRTKRELKNLVFVEVNDGSSMSSIQCTFERAENGTDAVLAALTTGTSVEIRGKLVPSPAAGQAAEVAAAEITVIGTAPAEAEGDIQENPRIRPNPGIRPYPLQKKRHSMEFLREIAHLRARTNTFGAVARVRNRMAFAVHQFFQERYFQYVHTPIITASDAEGAGAMFQITTLDLAALAQGGKAPDYTRDFFG